MDGKHFETNRYEEAAGVKCGDIGRGALLCGVVIGVAVGSYFLLADTYAVPWQRLTLGRVYQICARLL